MSIGYNKTILIGRLTRDVEVQYAKSGTAIVKNNVAVQRDFKPKEAQQYETDFINITAFGKTAEFIGNYFAKGNLIMIEGKIQTGSYEKEGRKVYTTDVIVDKVSFIETKKRKEESNDVINDVIYNDAEEAVTDGDSVPF